MRLTALGFAFAGAVAFSQDAAEPANFDVTAALYEKGVDVSAIPGLGWLATRASSPACAIACNALHFLFGDELIDRADTAPYANFTGSYWSQQQAQVKPRCILTPSTAEHVAIHVLLARLTQCPFAVKSGGHASFAGASSIADGVTVSLQRLREIAVAPDKKTAVIGPGNTWFDVYQATERYDVAPIGGRVAAIGVGGLTLGGGISFLSGLYGWACDNVASYELVTASGAVIEASPTAHADLYWALRGGGSNFGMVTKFTVYVYPLPGQRMWGGMRVSLTSEFPVLIRAFYNLSTDGAARYPDAAQILSFGFANGTALASALIDYAQPVERPAAFAEYLATTAVLEDVGIRTLSNLTQAIAAVNPDGKRETYWTATYKLSLDMTTACKEIFYDELQAIADAPGLVPAISLQTITPPMLRAMQARGGNPLGLSADDGPLLLADLNAQWDRPADDGRILQFSRNFVERTVQYARDHGLANGYLYQNYASQFQDVIAGYGAENKARLKSVAGRYDPTGVFQDLMPGYFKLDGPPAIWSQ